MYKETVALQNLYEHWRQVLNEDDKIVNHVPSRLLNKYLAFFSWLYEETGHDCKAPFQMKAVFWLEKFRSFKLYKELYFFIENFPWGRYCAKMSLALQVNLWAQVNSGPCCHQASVGASGPPWRPRSRRAGSPAPSGRDLALGSWDFCPCLKDLVSSPPENRKRHLDDLIKRL